jgi:hypothetical protein
VESFTLALPLGGLWPRGMFCFSPFFVIVGSFDVMRWLTALWEVTFGIGRVVANAHANQRGKGVESTHWPNRLGGLFLADLSPPFNAVFDGYRCSLKVCEHASCTQVDFVICVCMKKITRICSGEKNFRWYQYFAWACR